MLMMLSFFLLDCDDNDDDCDSCDAFMEEDAMIYDLSPVIIHNILLIDPVSISMRPITASSYVIYAYLLDQ